jgi:molecular chaperone DnaJ
MSAFKDPYAVLGVDRNASADEIKRAYRRKARENHPDLNPGDAGAAARMNDINEAYDRITNPEKYAARDRRAQASERTHTSYTSGGYGSAGYGGGQRQGSGQQQQGYDPFGWQGDFDWDDLFGFGGFTQDYGAPSKPEAAASDSAEIRAVIQSINLDNYQQAVNLLNAITSDGRNARWYYLSALANSGAGNQIMALEQIRKAVQMDPNNSTYQRVQRQLQHSGTSYQQESQAQGFSMRALTPQLLCCGFCVAEMLCQSLMMRGGVVPC